MNASEKIIQEGNGIGYGKGNKNKCGPDLRAQ